MMYTTKKTEDFAEIVWDIDPKDVLDRDRAGVYHCMAIGYDSDDNEYSGSAHIVLGEVEDVNDIQLEKLKVGSTLWLDVEMGKVLYHVLDNLDLYKIPSMRDIAIERLGIVARRFSIAERSKTPNYENA